MPEVTKDKALVIADAHIRARTWVNYPQLGGDAYAALHQLTQQIDGVETLVIAGDWFDTNRPSSMDILATNGFMSRFKNVLFIRGNHDSVSNPAWMEAVRQMAWELGEERLELDGASWFGISWVQGRKNMLEALGRTKEAIGQSLEKYPDSPVYLVLHASFKHLLGFDGWQLEIPDVQDLLAKGVRIIVGDIHVPDMQVSGNGWVLSPGALYPQSVDQVRYGHNACLLDIRSGEVARLHPDVRHYYEVCSEDPDGGGVLEQCRRIASHNDLPLPPFISVRCCKLPQEDLDELRGVAVVRNDQVERLVDDDVAAHETTGEPLSLEAAVEEELQDDDLKQMAGALLSSDDPLAEIERWLKFWKVSRI